MKVFGLVCAATVLLMAATSCSHRSASPAHPGGAGVNAEDGAPMVYVPAGKFIMGAGAGQLHGPEKFWFVNAPQHTVNLDAYWIYKTPVTVAQYREFCNNTGRPMPSIPPGGWTDNHPVVNVSWADAHDYAIWAGASLPTEAQWEKAARGTGGRVYPWGNMWKPNLCAHSIMRNGDLLGARPVGSYPDGASPYGALDMAGNVWQWCADWYDDRYYNIGGSNNPQGPVSGQYRVLRGGSWDYTDPIVFTCAYRYKCDPAMGNVLVGFRCVVAATAR